jgi:hypothetical protein
LEIFFGAFTSEWEQRRAALLHELSLGGGKRSSAEEEMRRRLKALNELGAAGGGGGMAGSSSLPKMKRARARKAEARATATARSMEARLSAVAQGSQPAVVKMASYGGGARVGAMLNYVSRGGELSVENENGERLRGRGELAALRGDWDHLFQNRAESRDIGGFTIEIQGAEVASDEALHELVRNTITSGFGDRRFAYAIGQQSDRGLTVQGLVVLRSGQGERLTGDEKAAGIVQSRYDVSAAAQDAAARFHFQEYGNGVEYGSSKLRSLVETYEGAVRDDRGQIIADEKSAGDLVQKEWRGDLHSRKSRDVMHLIMSARAGTDVVAFEGAVRDFLADQFGGHRYVFAMHDPAHDPKDAGEGGKRPHVHAHAIITMRSESGDRIETTPQGFREWRANMAEKARAHGIAMEMTDRREFASPPAYTRNQVRPVSREGRTEHVGTSEAAQARYDAKRTGRLSVARSDRSREYTIKVTKSWQTVALASSDRRVIAYAEQQSEALSSEISATRAGPASNVVHADFGSKFRANMVALQKAVLEGDELRETTRPEFEAYEKKVETALFRLERSVDPDERADFDEIAGIAREHVNRRRELMELHELKAEAQTQQEPREPDQRSDDRGREEIIKHGEAAVEAANEVMMEIDAAARSLADLQRPEPRHDPETGGYTYSTSDKEREETDQLRARIEQRYDEAISRAARLAAEGNTYIRELAEQDPDLKQAIETAERDDGRPAEEKDKTQANVDATAEQQRDPRQDELDRQPTGEDAREAHEFASTVDATNRMQDRLNREKEASQRGGETTRTDPAQQHIPRLQEFEREEMERKERDRDDRER